MALRLRYQTLEFEEFDVHLRTLRDRQQFEDPEGVAAAMGIPSAHWALFGIVWDSGRVLAEVMSQREVEGLRILEVGCGIGLASLVLNERQADITAADRHPEAEGFLEANVALNEGEDIPFVRSGWTEADGDELGRFDLIIGSDLLYEEEAVVDLAGFVARHARPRCTVVLVDPGRGLMGRFRRQLEAHGFTHRKRLPVDSEQPPGAGHTGHIHSFQRDQPLSG